jgi:predicted metal-dependent peptidase
MERKAEEKISLAKSRLMQLEPFFAMLLFKMPCIPSYECPTMGTEGTLILYNPPFVSEELLRKDVVFVLLHEVAHVFFKHHIRGPIKCADAQKFFDAVGRLKEKGVIDQFQEIEIQRISHVLKEWNYSTDYVINHHLKDVVKMVHTDKLDKIGIKYDKKYADMTSEKVYDKIKTPFDPDAADASDNMFGDMGIGAIYPAGMGKLTEQEVGQLEKELEADVKQAAMAAKKAGKMPAGMEEIIEDLYTTSTPWQDILRTIITSIAKQDYTFLYPNKRYTMHQVEFGVIMPSLWGEEYTDIGFIMDTSGSVGKEEKQNVSE